ncbi:MAG: hypothetical protein GY811_06820 [Myxococcales bacterium]|nr:hypothetical protein [Myxococcales bacterium]
MITDSEQRQSISPKTAELLAELLSGMGAWGLEVNATNAVSPAQARDYLLEILEGEADSREYDLKYYSKSDHGSDAELIGPVVTRAMSEVTGPQAWEEVEALGQLLRGNPKYKDIADKNELSKNAREHHS